jgi:hypothetical protein
MEVKTFGSFIAFIIIARLAGRRVLIRLQGMRTKLNG